MLILQWFLTFFIPLLAFSMISAPSGSVSDNLAPVKLILLMVLSLVGGLWTLWNASKGIKFGAYLKRYGGNTLLILIVLYLIWIIVASVLSPLPGYAFLGAPNLQFGSLLLFLCFIVALIYSASHNMVWIIYSFASTTLIMALWAFIEATGFKPIAIWLHSATMQFPAAAIGDRRHLGGWFAIMSLAPVFFYRNRMRDLWFWFWIISALVGIGLTTTTAATIGVGIGLFSWLLWSIRFGSWKIPATILVLFGAFVVALPPVATGTATLLGLKPPQLKDYGSTASFKPRLFLWKSAWNSVLNHPLFGQGDETFAYQVFNNLSASDAQNLFRAELGLSKDYQISYGGFAFYADNPKTKDHKAGSLIYVRAHDIVMDELYSHGFVGFGLLLGAIASLFLYVRRREPQSLFLFAIAIIPYIIYLLAWFYVPSVTPFFFILIGAMIADLKKLNSGARP
ncbi:O-antigen ligase family protein [Deinococcus sp.]|uniref:O-antigen ligase family protein n=1 Tax=Deinococcus sp. TaxID=47478 RepID=UPI003CC50724